MFNFSNYSTNSEYYDGSNKFVIAKMKDGTGGVAIEEFFGLKPKMYSFLVDYSSDSKKEKCVNRYVVATIGHSEDVLLNNKCLRHSMNRIQNKDHIIVTYEIKKLHCLVWCLYSKQRIRWISSSVFNFHSNQDSFFVKHFFSLVKTTFLPVCLNIVRLLAWHGKFKKRKALKKR